jgi:hypothetical protein
MDGPPRIVKRAVFAGEQQKNNGEPLWKDSP